MFAHDLRHYVIAPTLQEIGLYSESAEILVYGTGYVETGYEHLVQIGNPKDGGYGLFQDEPIDSHDLISWLEHEDNLELHKRVLRSCAYNELPVDPTFLISNLKLAVIFCRLHYWRVPNALPNANDAAGMAQYHKDHYNQGGKADVSINTKIFDKIIKGEL